MSKKDLITFSPHQLLKIISGGQTGADRGALEAAHKAGILTGGMAPKGWRTCAGSDPSLEGLGLVEAPIADYPFRTRINVEASDGTVAIASNFLSPGEVLTKKFCIQLKRPLLQISDIEAVSNPQQIVKFIIENNIRILNVAGNRDYAAAKNPSLHFDAVFSSILQVISILEQLSKEE